MEKNLRPKPWNIMKFLILLAFTLYVWNFFRSYFLFLIALLMICGGAVSALILKHWGNSVQVQALLPQGRIGRNTDFSFDIRLYNPVKFAAFTADVSYSRCNVFTGYRESRKERFWIPPGKDAVIGQVLNSRYAGRVEIRIEAFELYDFFCLFSLSGTQRKDASVVVWPSFSEPENGEIYSYVEDFPRENETKKKGTDYHPDYEIREYIPGDELKSIHWKLSAKQDQLMVRERLAAGREKINILLPLGDDRQQNDGLIDALYALCGLLLQNEYPLQIYRPGKDGALYGSYAAEEGELEHILEEILSNDGNCPPGRAQEQMAVECPGQSYILIQTGAYKGAYIRQQKEN